MTELKRRHSIELGSHMYSTASLKRPKTDTPLSPSIREKKDKLGEKISALQQLVSPFGKTDTASVLLEATEYIKFLQDQVQVLSAPYLHGAGKLQGPETQNLRSRGLCLVPVECSLKVAHSNGADIWAPTMASSKSEISSRR